MKRSMANRWVMYVKCVELGLAGGITPLIFKRHGKELNTDCRIVTLFVAMRKLIPKAQLSPPLGSGGPVIDAIP